MKYSELLNQLVLDRRTMEEIGRVETLWMHPPAHRVLGFICKAGLLGNQKSAFNLSQISAFGESGILTQGSPDGTTAERVRQLESLISHEIWSEEGDRIGKIIDCLFELESGRITHYLYVSSGWAGMVGEIYQLPTSTILSFGRKRVLVSDAAATQLSLYQAGLPQKLTNAKVALTQETTQEWQALTHRAADLSEQAKERLQSLSEQAKDQAQQISQQAKIKAQTLSEQLQEQLQPDSQSSQSSLDSQDRQDSQDSQGLDGDDRPKVKRQSLAAQVKAKARSISRQLEDGIETLTLQAEELFEAAIDRSPEASVPEASAPDSSAPDSSAPASPTRSPKSASSESPSPWEDDDEPWI